MILYSYSHILSFFYSCTSSTDVICIELMYLFAWFQAPGVLPPDWTEGQTPEGNRKDLAFQFDK